jgi:hypothetical integral membrane protein (TIGR02206 family)
MHNFFDLTEFDEVQIPMYGRTHLITVIIMILFLFLILWQKKRVKKIVANTRLVRGFLIVYLSLEAIYWSLMWGYRIEPLYERFPLHLCGSLSIFMAVLILLEKRNLVRFFSYWSICAGFISYANPGFVFYNPVGWGFFHYLVRHYFLFLAPIMLQIGWGFKHSSREFILSMSTLAGYAFLMFLLDWAIDANYMHLGRHNPLEIPFLPASFTVWPWTYPSFVGVGVILFHLAYFSFKLVEKNTSRIVWDTDHSGSDQARV